MSFQLYVITIHSNKELKKTASPFLIQFVLIANCFSFRKLTDSCKIQSLSTAHRIFAQFPKKRLSLQFLKQKNMLILVIFEQFVNYCSLRTDCFAHNIITRQFMGYEVFKAMKMLIMVFQIVTYQSSQWCNRQRVCHWTQVSRG